jgi:hypothetical protein
MKLSNLKIAVALTSLALCSAANAAATFNPFIIRSAAGAVTPVSIVGTSDGSSVTAQIDEGGEKAGYGTSFFNGQSVRSIGSVSYTRLDPGTHNPYVNFWVTDGTHHAVVAPNIYNSYGTGGAPVGTDVNGLNIQSLGVNIYETDTTDLSWLTPGGVYNSAFQGLATSSGGLFTPVKVSDLYSTLSVYGNTTFGGTGATKSGDGFAIIFGDTQGNFTNPIPYSLANVSVAATPEPTTLAALGAASAMGLRRRRRA